MKKISFKLILVICAGLLITSCETVDSTELTENTPVYQEYWVEYFEYLNFTRASASFRVRDKTGARVKLADNAYIKFNDEAGKHEPILNHYNWHSNSVTDVKFTFQNNQDKIFHNTLSYKDIVPVAVPSTLNSLDITNDLKIHWEGSPLGENEIITVNIIQKNINSPGEQSSGDCSVYEKGSTYVEIPKDFLRKLNPGEAFLYIDRSKIIKLDSEDRKTGGSKVATISVRKEITITK